MMENKNKLPNAVLNRSLCFTSKDSLFQLQNENLKSKFSETINTDFKNLCEINTLETLKTNFDDKNVKNSLHKHEQLITTNKQLKQEPLKFKIKLNAITKDNVALYEITSVAGEGSRVQKKYEDLDVQLQNQKNSSKKGNDDLSKKHEIQIFSTCEKGVIRKVEEKANIDSLQLTGPFGSPDLFEDTINMDEFENKKKRKQQEEEIKSSFKVARNEIEVIGRIKKFLYNVTPTASETAFKSSLDNLIILNKNKILNFCHKDSSKKNISGLISSENITKIHWPQTLSINYYGVNYNLSNRAEEIEFLYLSLVERFVKSETRSSFRSSPNIKKSNYLRTVPQSPRSRLSHLAKRRAMFSSENLLVVSQKTKNAIKKKQIIMTSIKSRPILKNKILTPRKKIVVNNKNCRTPSSIKRTRDSGNYFGNISLKETSKRVLFCSPLQSVPLDTQISKLITQPKEKLRVEKSKRALFSPENSNVKLLESAALLNKESDSKRRKITHVEPFSEEMVDNDFIKPMKCKSQNFCADIAQFSSSITQEKSLSQCSSDTHFSNQLSDSHKKKLLWAVSKALQNQKIGISHPKFKMHVSTLARAVKRLFLQFYQKRNSTSEALLKLSKKYVYSVINGKTTDEIYLMEKLEFENRTKVINTYSSRCGESSESFEIGENRNKKKSLGSVKSNINNSSNFTYDSAGHNNVIRNDENTTLKSSSLKKYSNTSKIDKSPYCIERRSDRKLFTGKDESNVSPCLEKPNKFYIKLKFNELINSAQDRNFMSAKRRISFDE